MSETRTYLDFEVIKEGWNIYNLRDGTTIKTRSILRSSWFVKTGNQKKYYADIVNMLATLCGEALQGEKTQEIYNMEKLLQSIEVSDCRYDTMLYEPEEYNLNNNTKILIHNNITKISRTTLYDGRGDRIYLTESNSSITITPPM